MRTIRIKLYRFNELSKDAKNKAVESVRGNGVDTSYIYDDAYNSVKAFHKLFGTSEDSRSWLDALCTNINGDVLELKGLRLRTYIINNFGHKLYKGKYYSLWSKTEKEYKFYPEGYPKLKFRHSKVLFDNSCVLTGVCYDDSLLQPIYEFLDWKLRPDYNSYMDFETLINDCFANLTKDVENEAEAANSDEAIIETIESNEYEFTKDGKLN